jgi:hypothetical protein
MFLVDENERFAPEDTTWIGGIDVKAPPVFFLETINEEYGRYDAGRQRHDFVTS